MWKGLNDSFKSIFVSICNTSKPSLEQMMENSFEANKRYNEFNSASGARQKVIQKNVDEKQKVTVNLATNMNKSLPNTGTKSFKYSCALCMADAESSASNHKLYNCTKFPNAFLKVKKLNSLNACVKCGYTNHSTRECIFNFIRKCNICEGPHFDFLCIKKQSSQISETKTNTKTNSKSSSKFTSKGTRNQLIQYAVRNETLEKVVLPTCSLQVTSGNKKTRTLRTLLDTGSQSSFILKDMATSLNLKVVEKDIAVSVFGFNDKDLFYRNSFIRNCH